MQFSGGLHGPYLLPPSYTGRIYLYVNGGQSITRFFVRPRVIHTRLSIFRLYSTRVVGLSDDISRAWVSVCIFFHPKAIGGVSRPLAKECVVVMIFSEIMLVLIDC